MSDPSVSANSRVGRAGAIAMVALAAYLCCAAAAPAANAAGEQEKVVAGAPIMAAAGPQSAPSALGNLLHSWVTALLLGIAGIVGIAHVAKRDIGKAVELGLVVLLVGGFAFAPDTVESLVKTFWQTVFGG